MSLLNSISGFGGANLMRELQKSGMNPAEVLSKKGLQKIETKSQEIAEKGFENSLEKFKNGTGLLKEEYFEAKDLSDTIAGTRTTGSTSRAPGIPSLMEGLVESVDAKGKVAKNEVRKLITGESDNLHQAMIAMQESGVAFNLLVEVRNKLVESYKELTRMVQ